MEKLISIKELFRKSFDIYKSRLTVFLGLMAINVVSLLVYGLDFFATGATSPSLSPAMAISYGVLGIICALIFLWTQVAFLYALVERDLTIWQYLQKAWNIMGSYIWVSILVGIITFIGFVLFIIPGIIFTVWYKLSSYTLIFDGYKGRTALSQSKKLVRGYWWAVFGRFLLIGIIIAIVSWFPVIGTLVNIFFLVPLSIIYGYLIYEDLKRIKTLPQ